MPSLRHTARSDHVPAPAGGQLMPAIRGRCVRPNALTWRCAISTLATNHAGSADVKSWAYSERVRTIILAFAMSLLWLRARIVRADLLSCDVACGIRCSIGAV